MDIHYHPFCAKHILAVFTSIWVSAGRSTSTNRTAQQEAIRAAAVFRGWPNGSRVNAAVRDSQLLLSPRLLNKCRNLCRNGQCSLTADQTGGEWCMYVCTWKEEPHTDRCGNLCLQWCAKTGACWSGVCAHTRFCHTVSRGDGGLSRDCFHLISHPPAPAGFWTITACSCRNTIPLPLVPCDFDHCLCKVFCWKSVSHISQRR